MKHNKFIIIASFLSITGTLAIYRLLPPEIPIHWGIDGKVDRFGPRYTAFLTAFLPLILYFLFLIIPKIDPRKDSYEKHRGAYKVIVLTVIFFLIGMHWAAMFYALGNQFDIAFWVKLCIGILFTVIGNFLPVIKPNYTLGIRTPWTLADRLVWEKTHRFGGYVFVVIGLIWGAMAFIGEPWVFYFLIGLLSAAVLSVFVYSYLLFRESQR